MARIDYRSQAPTIVAAAPRGSSWFGRFLKRLGLKLVMLLILFAIVFGFGTIVAAKTGLVTVPVVSSFVFQKPKPDHTVVAGSPIDAAVSMQVQEALGKLLTAGPSNGTASTLTLSEQTLTATLREKLNGSTMIDASSAQAAIVGSGVELFLPLKQNGGATAIVLDVTPSVENGSLHFTLTRFAVGSLSLPAWLTSWTLEATINLISQAITDVVGKYATVTGVTVENGAVNLNVTLNVITITG